MKKLLPLVIAVAAIWLWQLSGKDGSPPAIKSSGTGFAPPGSAAWT